MTDVYYLPASEVLRLFRSRELSPVELTRAVIERAEQVEPVVNAFAERLFEDALRRAALAEARYGPTGDGPRPLEGLPVAAKEEMDIAGRPATDGTLLRPPRVATRTNLLLARVEAAGGILHARTTTSEFCCLPMSHTLRWGVTRNPWNPRVSAAGSSGGSAASLAAGTSVLATGSDIGGSLRAPASLNGVVGFKPPHGRNPVRAPGGLDSYYHQGPLARSVADCALLQNVLAGPHPDDVRSERPAPPVPVPPAEIRGLRIAVSGAPGDFPVDPQVRTNTLLTAEALQDEGAAVEEVDIGWRLEEVNRALWAHFDSSLATEVAALAERAPQDITPYTLAWARGSVEMAGRVDAETGHRLETDLRRRLDTVFERCDALVVPTVGTTGFAAGEDYVDTRLVVAGTALEHFADASLTPVFNVCSAHPVLAVPSGWADNGVPTGVQVVARGYDDATAFRVAAAVERVRGAGFAGGRTPGVPDTVPAP